MRGKYQEVVLYRQKRHGNENITNCRGKTVLFLPNGCLLSVGSLAGSCWTESQSPRYSSALWGGGCVVTNDWCINMVAFLRIGRPPLVYFHNNNLVSFILH